MKLSSIYLLTGLVVFIIGTFIWQYILHLQLKQAPVSCTGELYFSNTCPLGQGCYYPPQDMTDANQSSTDPEANSAVQTIIDFQNGAKKRPGLGTCQPWLNNAFHLNQE